MLKKILFLLTISSTLAFSAHSNAQETPDKMIQRISDEVIAAVVADKKIQNGDPRRIRQIVDEKISPNLDFERTTSLAAGRYWREASAEQKQQLQDEFRLLLIHTYAGAMAQIRDQKIEYLPFRADPADTDVAVHARVKSSRGEPLNFGYRLIKSANGWKVYDVNVMGVWLVQTYKESFSAEIQKSGIDGLIKALADKNKSLTAKN